MRHLAIMAGFLAATSAAAAGHKGEFSFHPVYFDEVNKTASLAKAISGECPTLTLDEKRLERQRQRALARLEADGFDRQIWRARLIVADTDAYRTQMMKYEFAAKVADGAGDVDWCAAGDAEIRRESQVGALLRKVK